MKRCWNTSITIIHFKCRKWLICNAFDCCIHFSFSQCIHVDSLSLDNSHFLSVLPHTPKARNLRSELKPNLARFTVRVIARVKPDLDFTYKTCWLVRRDRYPWKKRKKRIYRPLIMSWALPLLNIWQCFLAEHCYRNVPRADAVELCFIEWETVQYPGNNASAIDRPQAKRLDWRETRQKQNFRGCACACNR